MQIGIEIKNKIAKRSDPNAFIVCGNSDYTIKFTFDEEWAEYEAKTARFWFNGEHVDVVFTGDECPVPVLSNIDGVFVGAFAGDLHTTTRAYIPCEKCILCLGGKVYAPSPDVYAQIMQMINDGMLKGEPFKYEDFTEEQLAELKGEKGDAGSVKMKVVQELPTENIETDTIYLLPNTSGKKPNFYDEYLFADGEWEMIGCTEIDLTDYVKKTDYATEGKAGVGKVNANFGVNITGDGEYYLVPAYDNEINDQNKISYKALLPRHISKAVKVGITTNTETWTDEDKAAACETIGAVSQQGKDVAYGGLYGYSYNPKNQKVYETSIVPAGGKIPYYSSVAGGGILKTSTPQEDLDCVNKKYADDNFVAKPSKPAILSVISHTVNGTISQISTTPVGIEAQEGFGNDLLNQIVYALARYEDGGGLPCGLPTKYFHTTPKDYVDNLPDYLTLTEEQKAKWRAFLGIE